MTALRFRSLASGSSGNATLVQGCKGDGQRFTALVDCGLKQSQLRLALQQEGMVLSDLDAIFVTHEHSDHVGPGFEIARRWQLPIWTSHGTWLAAGKPDCGGMLQLARDGQPLQWGAMEVLPFTVPHDAREPLQLRITQSDTAIALLTDLGHVTAHALAHASACHALLLEFNHEPELLAVSRYPAFLKRRIAGHLGHLSNQAAASLLAKVMHDGLRHVVAGHLSMQNNHPQHAQAAMRDAVGERNVGLHVASQESGCDWICANATAAQS